MSQVTKIGDTSNVEILLVTSWYKYGDTSAQNGHVIKLSRDRITGHYWLRIPPPNGKGSESRKSKGYTANLFLPLPQVTKISDIPQPIKCQKWGPKQNKIKKTSRYSSGQNQENAGT